MEDLFLRYDTLIFQKLRFYTSMIQWTAEPKTEDMLVAFANSTHDAFTQPVTQVNLYKLFSLAK